jgi:solute carrier family 35, member E1
VCVGVGISCIHDDSFGLGGFLAAAASNVAFSARAVLTKHLFRIQTTSAAIDEVCLFTYISNIGLVLLVPPAVISEGNALISLIQRNEINLVSLSLLLFLNGVAYSTYNLASFLVLAKTDIVTHAVLNVFRRVFIILFTSCYFNVTLSALNMFGVALAVCGFLLFTYFKSHERKVTDSEKK